MAGPHATRMLITTDVISWLRHKMIELATCWNAYHRCYDCPESSCYEKEQGLEDTNWDDKHLRMELKTILISDLQLVG
jgi:hypothetical protein